MTHFEGAPEEKEGQNFVSPTDLKQTDRQTPNIANFCCMYTMRFRTTAVRASKDTRIASPRYSRESRCSPAPSIPRIQVERCHTVEEKEERKNLRERKMKIIVKFSSSTGARGYHRVRFIAPPDAAKGAVVARWLRPHRQYRTTSKASQGKERESFGN